MDGGHVGRDSDTAFSEMLCVLFTICSLLCRKPKKVQSTKGTYRFISIILSVQCECVIDSGIIEESPKWHLLSMVLDEIRKESAANTKSELCLQS